MLLGKTSFPRTSQTHSPFRDFCFLNVARSSWSGSSGLPFHIYVPPSPIPSGWAPWTSGSGWGWRIGGMIRRVRGWTERPESLSPRLPPCQAPWPGCVPSHKAQQLSGSLSSPCPVSPMDGNSFSGSCPRPAGPPIYAMLSVPPAP